MNVKYTSENGKTEAILSEESDWDLFDRIARMIANEFNGHWIEKLDGLHQRYWDLQIEKIILTLHLEHYSGISLFPDEKDNHAADNLVRKIGDWIEVNI